ncbi:MAG: Competence protein ComEA helix-hairpin-helix repeat protein [Candidatus Gottesmanbacteria bacterium GW2011_GWB1_49_7]|uniref:Competence protein ComEA helix-hairpin-helix repeat protein n=1 Tax=Candidatus Gottesmanbacteria bacterium GW2011_GWB1_49_7 TaxID=1618448 RepID=A0A0G1VUI3_9BACT|nr:MAG: Competence protein ComEA helix-hairpin-helix repeat protein [Candidatus Gottesmanbacteria bacterium GW2011_GWB1_49_7]
MVNDVIREWVEAHRWEVLGVLVGAALIGSGMFWLKSGIGETRQPEVVLSASSSAKLVVDVGGEVINPGIYELLPGARVEEALVAAGGLSAKADTDYINKYLNRAAKLSDGQKLYIPRVGAENAQRSTRNAQININLAGQGELEGLPGVGPVTAEKIMAGRPYQNVSELVGKKIVGEKLFDQIKDLVSIW